MSSRRRPFTVDDLELHHKIVSTTCSADGALAVCAVKTVDREQDKHVERLWAFDAQGPRQLTHCNGQDQSPQLSPDGRTLAFVSDRSASHRSTCCPIAGEKLFYCVDHPSLPSELWSCSLNGTDERRLSRFNAWWGERTGIEAQVRSFSVPDGKGGQEQVEGWLIRPADARDAGPLLNDVHGGPASYALMDVETNVYWQVLCSRGWSVLALNAAGSASYGPEFCARLAGRWGELDLPQHLAAVRALQDDGVCDDRVAICGKSYGG